MPPSIALHMLGPWELRVDGKMLPKPSTQKAQSLLAYLVVHDKSAHPREKLATLFWPDADDDRAQRSLRTALWSLRRLLEHGHPRLADALVATRFDVRWTPPIPVEVDSVQFEAAIQTASRLRKDDPQATFKALQTAASLYRGPLLEGLYDDWCLNERYRLEERYLRVLEALVTRFEAAGQPREAIACAQRLLTVDPLREDMHRVVIRLLGTLGDRTGAARQYQRCKEALQQEMAAAPSPETEAVYAAVRAAPAPRTRPSGHIPIPSPTPQPVPLESEQPIAGNTPEPSHPAPAGIGTQPAPALLPEPYAAQLRGPGAAPLVGRQTEWQALTTGLAQAEAGRGHAILLAGEAGSGKTRLLEEVAARARWRSMRVLWGRCYEYERVLPYQPFAEALRSGLQVGAPAAIGGEVQAAPPDGATAGTHGLADTLAALPPIWQQALLLLLPEWADRVQVPALPLVTRPGEEQGQLLEGISQFLIALAGRQPLLLVIDDLHWATPSTLHLFHHLARNLRQQPILLLGAYRPEDLAQAAAPSMASSTTPLLGIQRSLQAEGALDVVTLDPLDPTQVADLVAHVSGWEHTGDTAGDPSATALTALAERLHRYTQGNPLYLLATLQALQDSHAITLEPAPDGHGSRWSPAAAAALTLPAPPGSGSQTPVGNTDLPLPIPDRIRDLLQERLERVSPPAREAARLAAVAGREFDLAILERVSGKGEEETLLAVDELLAARFLREGALRGARDFAFTHHLLQESIYHGLPRAVRTRTHRKVAEAMEAAYGPRAVAAELAFHYEAGGALAQAIPFARAAADQAAAGYANEDALRHYAQALTLLAQERERTPPAAMQALEAQRFDLLAARLAVRQRLGMPGEEAADVTEMLALARALGDLKREILALLQQSLLERRAGRYSSAEVIAQEALAQAQALAGFGYPADLCLALEARAHDCLGDAYLLQDNYAPAIAAYERALTAYRSLGTRQGEHVTETGIQPARGEAGVLRQMGWLYEHTGEYATARRYHEQALALYQKGGDLAGEADARGHLGNISWFTGEFGQAHQYYEAALDLERRIGYRRGAALNLRNLGLVLWRRGDLEQALDCHQQALAIFEALHDPEGIVECCHSIGDVHYVVGRLEEALSGYLRALDLARAAGSSHHRAQSLVGCARVERAQGLPGQALARIAEARPLCQSIGYPRGLAWCDREAGCAELDQGHAGSARDLLRAAVDRFAALGEPGFLAATRAELALAHLALNELEPARALALQAAETVRTPDHGVDQPQAILFALYRVLLARGDLHGATEALVAAQAEVAAQAAHLDNPDLRASFLQAVPINRAITGALPPAGSHA